jgi:hypothetical protein
VRLSLSIAFALGAIAAASTTSARAATGKVEFCPATASVAFPIGATFGTAARTFGYDLTAQTPRSVTATIIADTSAGWFSWTTGNVALSSTKREAHLRAMPRVFQLMPYVIAASPTLSVTFPEALTLRHLWVSAANATACEVPAFEGRSDTVPSDPADVARSPSALYPVALATPAQPPFASTGCDQPFSADTVIKAEAPDYPVGVREMDVGPVGVAVEVALDRDGNIVGTWIYAGSGFAELDRASLQAAPKSTYRGSISYCRPVYSTYVFLTNFMPGGY